MDAPHNGKQQNGQKPSLSWSQPNTNQQQNAQPKQAERKEQPKPAVATQAEQDGTGKIIGIIVGVVVICVLAAWGIIALRNKSNTATLGTTASSTETTAGVQTNTQQGTPEAGATESGTTAASSNLSIPSPQDAGMQVAVTNAEVTAPTWIVVYENHNGIPGNALGAALFFPTTKSGVVNLLRGTLPGQTYFVGEALDNGDKIFSLKDDLPMRDQSGNPIWVKFQTR